MGRSEGVGAPAPTVFAHRGASRDAPENTLAAFARARRLGADGVELDVHLAHDGVLVVHHDTVAAGVGPLAHRALAEIRAARPDIPTLAEALDECAGLLVNVEIKSPSVPPGSQAAHAVADTLLELLARRRGRDRVIVSSFDLDPIDRVHERGPHVPTGWLTIAGFDPLRAVEIARERGHAALHPDVRALGGSTTALVERAHDLGLAVTTWTVDDPGRIRELAAAGVDGVITNRPDVALRALGRVSGSPA